MTTETISSLDAGQRKIIEGTEARYDFSHTISIPRYEAFLDSDRDSDYGEATDTPDEDVRSIVGFSIGKEQTRLKSPETPAVVKAAALEKVDGEGFFDELGDTDRVEDPSDESTDTYSHDGHPSQSVATTTQEGVQDLQSSDFPSPWVVRPKKFQKVDNILSDNEVGFTAKDGSSAGPTSILADLNFKRFLSSFNLPSLPKGTSLKDFSMPNIPSIIGGSKDVKKPHDSTRPRAKTLCSPKIAWRSISQEGQITTRNTLGSLGPPEVGSFDGHVPNVSSLEIPQEHYMQSVAKDRAKSPRGASSTSDSRAPLLRRVTSDNSLHIHKTLSIISSLGDDSRWEKTQDQVNSRMKAIKDSFQDSAIRLPSLPALPSLNLNVLRHQYLRRRSSSDTNNALNSANGETRGIDANIEPVCEPSVAQKVANGYKHGRKKSKPTYGHLERALDNLTGDLVIMGGYRGSILRSAKPPHRQLWVPVKVGLNIRRVNLEVGLRPDDEDNMEESIIASGMLTHVGPVDISRRLIKRLRSCTNAQLGTLRVHDYGYDWRLSPHLQSRKLIEFLEKLPCNLSGTPTWERGATVIAHSLGGLITRNATNQRPQLFAGILYAGVPQHCVNILGPLRNGDDVLLSSRVLTAQVNFTFRSSYALLPEDGSCFIDKHTKEEYPVDFFNVETWREYCLSPCIASTLPALDQPEKKGLLGSMSDSLPSLPLVRRGSPRPPKDRGNSAPDAIVRAANSAGNKVQEFTNPEAQTMDMSMGNSNHVASEHSSSSVSTTTNIPRSAALNYLHHTLNDVLAFKRALAFRPEHHEQNLYPPVSVLYGTSVPTVYGARVTGRHGIRRADAYDDLAFASGDGVCLARAAMLPKGYEVCLAKGGKVRTERGHVGLLGDLESVGRCLESVIRARREGIGCGELDK